MNWGKVEEFANSHRGAAAVVHAPGLNERERSGYYISDVQDLGNGLDLMGAWAHAGGTPGDPDFGTADDKANLYVIGVKYHYDKQAAFYLTGAMLKQGAGAHCALGAGGHGTAIASPRNDAGAYPLA